jgi:hypothetical protein
MEIMDGSNPKEDGNIYSIDTKLSILNGVPMSKLPSNVQSEALIGLSAVSGEPAKTSDIPEGPILVETHFMTIHSTVIDHFVRSIFLFFYFLLFLPFFFNSRARGVLFFHSFYCVALRVDVSLASRISQKILQILLQTIF